MDKKQLDEWTMHMAAGTDPLTAWAATPQGDDDDPKPPPQWLIAACYIVAIIVGLVVFFMLTSAG